MLSMRCEPGPRPPATRRFFAKCRLCAYEFVERSRAELVEAVESHEAECSDDEGEWSQYRVGGDHSLSSSPPSALNTNNGRGVSNTE